METTTLSHMKPQRFRHLLERCELSRIEAGEFLGVDVATVRGYADGSVPIPRAVAMLLEVLNNWDLEPADAEFVIDAPVTLQPK